MAEGIGKTQFTAHDVRVGCPLRFVSGHIGANLGVILELAENRRMRTIKADRKKLLRRR